MLRTIIHAFVSFLLLSYVKIAVVSFTLLHYTRIFHYRGSKQTICGVALYGDPTVKLLDSQHVPYLSLFMLLVFTLLPLIVLVLYPLRLT